MVLYVSVLFYGVGGIVVAGVALLVAFQEKLVYVPVLPGLSKSYPITPARLRLNYEDVWLRSSDRVRLHAWFIKLFPDCRAKKLKLADIGIVGGLSDGSDEKEKGPLPSFYTGSAMTTGSTVSRPGFNYSTGATTGDDFFSSLDQQQRYGSFKK